MVVTDLSEGVVVQVCEIILNAYLFYATIKVVLEMCRAMKLGDFIIVEVSTNSFIRVL